MKRLLAVLMVVACLLTAMAAAEAPAEEVINVGVSFPTLEDITWVVSQQYIQDAAADFEAANPGVKINITLASADNDSTKQNSQILDFLSSEMDVVLAGAVDTTALWESIVSCHAKDVPICLFIRAIADGAPEAPDAQVVANCYNVAYQSGKTVLEKMLNDGYAPEDIYLVHIVGRLNDQNALLYRQGYEDAIQDVGGGKINVVAEVASEWDVDTCLQRLSPVLMSNIEKVNCILVPNDNMQNAVQPALEQIGKWIPYGEEGHIYVAGQGGQPISLKFIQQKYIDVLALNSQKDIFGTAIQFAVELARGNEVGDADIPVPVLTHENWDELEEQGYLWGIPYMD